MKRKEGFRVKDTWALSKQCTMGQQTRQTFLQWKSLRTKRVSKVRLIDVRSLREVVLLSVGTTWAGLPPLPTTMLRGRR